MQYVKPITAALVACTLLSGAEAQGQTPYVTETTLGFESFCNGTMIPDSEFDASGVSFDARVVPTGLFAGCGIESIDDIGQALGESAYLVRPSLDQPAFDPINGVSGTALTGNVGTGIGGFILTFGTPVNELSIRVVDVEEPEDANNPFVFEVEDDDGNRSSPTYAWSGNVVTFSGDFPDGVKRITLDYGGAFDNWALDEITFNTWSCGDGEAEALNGEECDDGDEVECDGCRNDCRTDISGCLVDGTCVADGTLDPESAGCATCDQPLADPPADVVGYTGYEPADTDCTALGNDGLSCTNNVCDGQGRCVHPVADGFCAIGTSCFLTGVGNQDNPCQVCDADVADRQWSPRPMGTVCDDGDACTDDTPADGDETNGDVCNDVGQCVGGEPLDCDDGLSCTVDSCKQDTGCESILAAGCLIANNSGDPVCRSSGEGNPDDPCLACNPSEDDAAWTARSEGERCGDPSCEAGELTPAPTCDEAGTCVEGEETTCDGAVCADAVSCTGTCTRDDQCLTENFCEAGECVPDRPAGETCERDSQCGTGFCADGVCCDRACGGRCEACNLEGNAGECTPHAVGTDPEGDCPSEPEVQVCNGKSECIDVDRPNGTECEVAGECESGHCVDGVCCDTPCDGVCSACNLDNDQGTCSPYSIQTDPENECDQACNGAGECVSFEVRGNGFCTAQPGRSAAGTWALVLAALGVVLGWRRRFGG